MNHLRANGVGELLNEFALAVNLTAITDDAAQPHARLFGVLYQALTDVIGRIDGHHFARSDNVDLLRFAVADRHGESAANHVAQHIEENKVKIFGIGLVVFHQIDGRDDAAPRAAYAWFRTARLHASYAAVTDLDHLVVSDFFRAFFTQHVHQRYLRLAA